MTVKPLGILSAGPMVSLAAACCLLTACVPALKAPPAAIQSVPLPAPSAAAGVAGGLTSTWWTVFGDPVLNQLLAQALADNPGLAEAQARVEAAQAAVGRVEAIRSVHADADTQITRQHNAQNGDRAIYNGETYSFGHVEPLNLNYHLDLWGQDKALIALAQDQAEIAQAQQAQVQLHLTDALIRTYLAWQTAGALVAQQQTLTRLAEDALRIRQVAVRTGIAPAAEAAAEQGRLHAVQARLADLTQQQDALRYALLALLGQGPEATLPAAGTPTLPAQLPLPAGMTLDTLAARPDIRIARWRASAAARQLKLAKTAYYPNVNLRGLIGLTSIGLGTLFQGDSVGYAFGPAINLPLFEGGALDARLREADAGQAAAIHGYNQTVLNAAAQVATALASLDHSRQVLTERAGAQAEAARVADSAEAGYRSGVSDRLGAVQAQQQRVSADMDYLNGRLAWLDAVTDIATDLGGGIQAP